METDHKKKRRVAAIVAVLALVATTLGGTFAYQDYMQHKSNELGGESIKYEARLVEDFAEINDWKVSDGPVTKKISVVNHGARSDFGNVYVRIQLKEYMEIGTLTYNETPERYMIDTDGVFIVFATEGAAITATAPGGIYASHNYKELTDAVTGAHGYFIETQDHDPNGQMGKHVIYDYTVGNPEAVIAGGPQHKAASTNHHEFPSDECSYATHSWKTGSDLETREYIEWQLNTGAIITLTEWLAAAGLNGMPVDKWVIDDTNDEGWVYWGRALEPGGSTALFMESVTLILQPDGSFYYVIHTDMQAVSLDELISGDPDWGDAGDAFIKNSPKLAFDGPAPATVKVGETIFSPGVISTPDNVDPADLIWTSSDPAVAAVDENGVVTGVSVGGPVTIIVKAPNGAKTHFTITVIPADEGQPDDKLPLIPDGGGGYTPIKDPDDSFNGDGLYAKKDFDDPDDPFNNEYYHDGAVHLEDVIADGNFTGVTATASDPKYSGYITIGNDHHGKPSILFSYVPNVQELRDWAQNNPGRDICLPVQVELARPDGKTAIITINMYYWGSLLVF